jgi:arylsulfatase A-like enzyme
MGVVQREQGEKARWPWIQTPNMDRLAREGVRFRNAFVVNSLCAPSRASFLTGCYGYINGVVNNHTEFPVDNVTYATLLRQAGYRTGYIGKWHMGKQSGQRPGFDYSASFVGQGHYTDCPFEINGKSTPTRGWVDDVSTEFAVNFLRENKDRPFVLAVGFKSPHGPWTPPPRLTNFYGGQQARTVPNLNIPAIYLGAADYGKAEPTPPGLVPANMNYHRVIHGADENLGKLLDELDKLGLANNTMVIFTSDNGYYQGEHRLGDKRSAYEESMRVPLLVRYPKLANRGKVVDTATINIDVAPTMLDYAGVAIPAKMQGRSWKPLLEGDGANWRRAFFYCYYFERGFRTPTMMAVRNDAAKLVKYPGHEEWTELFDVKRDPYEIKNLIADPTHAELRKQMESLYNTEAQAIGFQVPSFADDPQKGDLSSPRKKECVLDYRFEADTDAGRAEDRSGKSNHGSAQGVPLVEGRAGHKARRFDGEGYIAVAKSPSLSPVSQTWTIEATLRADRPDGIILAHGGATNGYCLYLRGGKPAFTVNAQNRTSTVVADRALPQGWNHLIAKITAEHRLMIVANDRQVANGRLKEFIHKEPNDALEIGADLRSKVVSDAELPKFVGLMESVKISSD